MTRDQQTVQPRAASTDATVSETVDIDIDIDIDVDRDDPALEARAAVTLGLYTSAARCLLQYVVAPVLGTIGVVLGPVGLVLQLLGAVVAVSGARRLHRLHHRAWPGYAVVAALVVGVTGWSLLDAAGVLR